MAGLAAISSEWQTKAICREPVVKLGITRALVRVAQSTVKFFEFIVKSFEKFSEWRVKVAGDTPV